MDPGRKKRAQTMPRLSPKEILKDKSATSSRYNNLCMIQEVEIPKDDCMKKNCSFVFEHCATPELLLQFSQSSKIFTFNPSRSQTGGPGKAADPRREVRERHNAHTEAIESKRLTSGPFGGVP